MSDLTGAISVPERVLEEDYYSWARTKIAALEDALTLLIADCSDYEPWQRPCLAFDNAKRLIAQGKIKAEGK
jgi:hypothetical protein